MLHSISTDFSSHSLFSNHHLLKKQLLPLSQYNWLYVEALCCLGHLVVLWVPIERGRGMQMDNCVFSVSYCVCIVSSL